MVINSARFQGPAGKMKKFILKSLSTLENNFKLHGQYAALIKIEIVLYFLCSISALIFLRQKLWVIIGLTFGAFLNTCNFISNALHFFKISSESTAEVFTLIYMVKYIYRQVGMIILLAVCLKLSIWLFGGMVVGILLMTLSIMIYAFYRICMNK